MKKALVLVMMILATAFVAGAKGGSYGRASSRARSYTSRSYIANGKTSTTHSHGSHAAANKIFHFSLARK